MQALSTFLCLLAPLLGGDDFDEASRGFRDAYPDARARAVRRLAKLGSREAWERVREALEDPDPQVADSAQRAMAAIQDPRVFEGWLGREGLGDRDAWVRLRVAQVAGAAELPVDAKALARALDPRDSALSRALCRSVALQANAGRLTGKTKGLLGDLERLFERASDPNLRAEAWVAARSLGAPLLIDYGEEQEPLLRAALVRESMSLAQVRAAATDDDPRVRVAALDRLLAKPERASLPILVDRLEHEPRLALRRRLLSGLQRMSGMKHRMDVRPWKRWLADLSEDWQPVSDPPEKPHTEAQLDHLPLPSDRICVLVDLSGSLWAEREDGRSRKDLLDDAVADLLGRMPEDAWFNLIPYATDPKPWKDALVPATARNIRDAAAAFADTRLTGKGNVWDALQLAFADPAVDTVLIITDGAPTGGHRWDLFLMTELIEAERRWSGVAVSTVLVDSSDRLRRRWRDVAECTGGESWSVEFPSGE